MNQQLLERVLKSPRLPSLPTIALEVIDLVQQHDVNIKQIANTIQHDPALSSKILKTVNSSFYGQAHSISTISHALVVLGLNSVKTLALGFTLVNNLASSDDEGFDHLGFWKRSLYTAVAARDLAKAVHLVQQEEAFLGGLLQDLGLLAMAQTLGDEYQNLIAEVGPQHQRLWKLEQERLDTDHAAIGGALAESWHLPPLLVEPIRFHEQPDLAPEELLPLARCVALGGRAADVFMTDQPGEALADYHQLAKQWFELGSEQAEPLLKTIHIHTVEMNRLFDLPTDDFDNADEILARANEALTNLSLQQQRQQIELQQQTDRLLHEANTDSLTGAANRRRFNEFIAEAFEKVKLGSTEPMSLLFFDADHFKKFNDTYGHQTGDRVLIEMASTLKANMPDRALVARYGGEEFAIVLPDTDRLAAAKLAEQVRHAIEKMPVESEEGEQLHVTSSIGVSVFDGGTFQRVEQFIRAADQAVYAAKSSGRNCVRIFSPRPAKVAS
jgi:diguanylate cyclase (GGDEF)-like protein